MKLGEVLDRTVRFFQDKGFPSARLDAELLISRALDAERIRLYLEFDRPLTEPELASCRELVRRRSSGEPVAYITGKKGFFGHEFLVSPAVLIPRPESELIVEEATSFAKALDRPSIVDLGAGSGCLGLSILSQLPSASLLALDVSAHALEVARANAVALGLSEKARFLELDASSALSSGTSLSAVERERVDVIVANPPYIDPTDPRLEEQVKRFEPALALFGGKNGLEAPRAWLKAWSGALAERSIFLMEIGMDQGPAMKEAFESSGVFSEVTVLKDLAGLDRVIKGVRNG
jgi:release factor glutamine methyltransferase